MSDKILRAHIESYKGVVDTEIDLQEKNIVAVIGDGGTGKTSIIEFFKSVVTGTIEDHHINIGRGRAKGGIEFQLDGKKYSVKFTKTKNSETVTVTSPDNMKGGKEVLRQLVGAVAIDPFYLQNLEVQEQIKEFKKLMRIDTKEMDRQIKEAEGEREVIGRQVRSLDGSIKTDPNNKIDFEQHKAKYAMEKPLEDRPARLKAAIDHNQEYAGAAAQVSSLKAEIDKYEEDIADIEKQIEALMRKRDDYRMERMEAEKDMATTSDWLAKNPLIDISAIQAEIDEINEFNRERMSLQAFFSKKAEHAEKVKEYNEQKALVDRLKNQKEEFVKKNLVSIPGFEFLERKKDAEGKVIDDREGPYYNGIPLSGLSTTELITFAIAFKKALVGGLPIVIVDDFESVGSKGREALEQMCREGKCQAIVSLMDPKVTDLKIVLKNDLNITAEDIAKATNGHEEFEKANAEEDKVSKDALADFENQSKEQ